MAIIKDAVDTWAGMLGGHVKLRPDLLTYFIDDKSFKGGWEEWLQAEFAYSLKDDASLTREVPFPSPSTYTGEYVGSKSGGYMGTKNKSHASRADFLLTTHKKKHEIYMELKTQTQGDVHAAWKRYQADIEKLTAVYGLNNEIVMAAVLVTFQTIDYNFVKKWKQLFSGYSTYIFRVYSHGKHEQVKFEAHATACLYVFCCIVDRD